MRNRGSFLTASPPSFTSTSTGGVFKLNDAAILKAANQYPRGPAAPTSLSAAAGNARLSLSWTAPSTTHGTITNYLVEYTASGGSAQYVLTGSTSTSYTLTGLTNGTSYSVRVAAVNFTAGDWSGTATGTPTNSSLLMHFDGANGSTTFANSAGTHTFSRTGAVSISTARSKFGGASAFFNDGWLDTTPTSDTTFGTGDFTIDFWVYLTGGISEDGSGQILTMTYDGFNPTGIRIWYLPDRMAFNISYFHIRAPASEYNQWNHWAMVRSSDVVKIYKNGVEQTSFMESTGTLSGKNLTEGLVRIGANNGGDQKFLGYLDELRIAKTAIWTSNFTPPTVAY